MKRTQLIVPIIILSIVVIWIAYTFWRAYQPQPERIQGQIEAQQYNISSKVAGRINEVMVKKGDFVERNQLIFTLLSPEIEAKLAQAVAGKNAAADIANEVAKGARIQQISAAKNQWGKAKTAALLMKKTYNRINNLYTEGVVAEQKRDEAYTQWQAASFTEKAAHQMYILVKQGPREETKKAAKEKEKMASGAVAEVKAFASDTKIKSWHKGEVSQVLLHSGELAPQGFPVVSIIDINDAWAVFHLREDLLKNYTQGTELNVHIPALGSELYPFTVTHVAVMGEFATWRATDSSQGFDMRTFEIEARPKQKIAGLRVGMSAIIE